MMGSKIRAVNHFFMNLNPNHHFSGAVTIFHERALPEKATPAGHAALVDAYGLPVPLPRTLFAIGEHPLRTPSSCTPA